MNYKNTIKRFSIERLPDEDHDEFIERVDIITNARMSILRNDYSLELDEDTSFIFDENDSSLKGKVLTAIVDIHEIPQEISLNDFTLLIYCDNIKQKSHTSYKVTDIDLDYARGLL